MREILICAARRTPIGAFGGALSEMSAPDLGAIAIRSAMSTLDDEPPPVDEVVFGCVLPAGLGQAPARQAGKAGGLPDSVPATTVNKMCGSGMKAVMLAHDQLASGQAEMMIAGGMESMSNAPYLLPRLRTGNRLGDAPAVDHMFIDGLEDAYETGRLMGEFAEDCAEAFGFTREDQDRFAIRSLERATAAQQSGRFAGEITPITPGCGRSRTVTEDEQPQVADKRRIPMLRPAFRNDGSVTAANSSSISDGAAALVLASADLAAAADLGRRARIVGHASAAQRPALFTTAPSLAASKLLARIGWSAREVDLWEVNEAFAVVAMAFARQMDIPEERMNIHGGACALGHPIGASGARILVTLLHALEAEGLRRGIAAICIGGGEATAVAMERP